MENRPSKSPQQSPRVAPLTRQLSGLGAKLGNVFGTNMHAGTHHENDDTSSIAWSDTETLAEIPASSMQATPSTDGRPRAVSRGRDALKSTGRGGAGNIRTSPSIGSTEEAVASLSPARGREMDVSPDRAKSVGRGGVGNIRSQSQARAASQIPEGHPQTASIVSENQATKAAYEKQVIEDAAKSKLVHSSGRGGAGNISGSRSRSRGFFGGSDTTRHSSGRGGAGNIRSGADGDTLADEEQLRASHDHEGIHSTGRGGAANLTGVHSPLPEVLPPHQHPDPESSGRGGVGNIRSRSNSRDAESQRSPSRDPFSKLWQKVTQRNIHEEPTVATRGVDDSIQE